MSQVIVGAGMAGLLAARMLQRHRPVIYEAQTALPNNHSAVLRFATNKVSEVLGIPFKKVALIKTVMPWRNPVADAMAYSRKVLGEYRSDRSVLLPERWTSTERWIAPENLIEQMAEGVDIAYSVDYDFAKTKAKVISTIPMPVLANRLKHRDLGWRWKNGKNISSRLSHTEAYVSVMVPDPDVLFYRASVTGDLLIVEVPATEDLSPKMVDDLLIQACLLLGVESNHCRSINVTVQTYAKIVPIDEDDRKNFIYWASTELGRAYQLGRYATWRPRLLLDDLVHDVRLIEGWMTSGSSNYTQQLRQASASNRS